MDKIQIRVACKACNNGVGYLASTIAESGHAVCQPCSACQGSGTQDEWIDLREFIYLLSAIGAEKKLKTPQNTAKHRIVALSYLLEHGYQPDQKPIRSNRGDVRQYPIHKGG